MSAANAQISQQECLKRATAYGRVMGKSYCMRFLEKDEQLVADEDPNNPCFPYQEQAQKAKKKAYTAYTFFNKEYGHRCLKYTRNSYASYFLVSRQLDTESIHPVYAGGCRQGTADFLDAFFTGQEPRAAAKTLIQSCPLQDFDSCIYTRSRRVRSGFKTSTHIEVINSCSHAITVTGISVFDTSNIAANSQGYQSLNQQIRPGQNWQSVSTLKTSGLGSYLFAYRLNWRGSDNKPHTCQHRIKTIKTKIKNKLCI